VWYCVSTPACPFFSSVGSAVYVSACGHERPLRSFEVNSLDGTIPGALSALNLLSYLCVRPARCRAVRAPCERERSTVCVSEYPCKYPCKYPCEYPCEYRARILAVLVCEYYASTRRVPCKKSGRRTRRLHVPFQYLTYHCRRAGPSAAY
jgi:hypothetical protein